MRKVYVKLDGLLFSHWNDLQELLMIHDYEHQFISQALDELEQQTFIVVTTTDQELLWPNHKMHPNFVKVTFLSSMFIMTGSNNMHYKI